MLRGIWGDPERFIETYWAQFGDQYFAGDGARLDEDGDIWLLGRVDDVMNVSGHRLSTAEIESALVAHPSSPRRRSSARPTRPPARPSSPSSSSREPGERRLDDRGGERARCATHVADQIGAIARPRRSSSCSELPKTRSGKIMRRLLRDVAEGREIGDTTTLADTAVMQVDQRPDELPADPTGRSDDGRRPGAMRTGPSRLSAEAVTASANARTSSTSTGESSGSTATPTARAGVHARVAEDLAEHLGGAVDHAGLAGERRVRGDEAR